MNQRMHDIAFEACEKEITRLDLRVSVLKHELALQRLQIAWRCHQICEEEETSDSMQRRIEREFELCVGTQQTLFERETED